MLNAEPLTQTDRMSNLCTVRQCIKVYSHFYLMTDEVCIKVLHQYLADVPS